MKGFTLVLLCVLVAVQARSSVLQRNANTRLAALGDSPWTVHIRIAIWTSGILNTGAGSLIHASWILTSGSSVNNSRFIWLRYGVVHVFNSELVTEASSGNVYFHPLFDQVSNINNIALIGINRVVHSTPNIAPVTLESQTNVPGTDGQVCIFGQIDNRAGEDLNCLDVTLTIYSDALLNINSDGTNTTYFDLGAPLLSDGVQVGLLVEPPRFYQTTAGLFLRVSYYLDWIQTVTGITFG